MKKNGFYLQDGDWYKDGVCFPFIARIKPDYCLKVEEVRQDFPPNSFVYYCLNDLSVEKCEKSSSKIYFACVRDFDNPECHKIPLGMLEFTEKQKEEIIKVKKFPKSVFEKKGFMHLDPVFNQEMYMDSGSNDFFDDYL